MNRGEKLDHVRSRKDPWDVIVIGGGATGIGCAVDAAGRGLDVLLLEQHDFGKGTSSRSTKLIHGGVRYLEQGNISLVREALKERGILRRNAPHQVKRLAFIIPCYSWWQKLYFGTGLKCYDLLSGKYSFGKSRLLSRPECLSRIPGISKNGLKGGVLYYDGQFDDTRLLIDLAKTAIDSGAYLFNYAKVSKLTKNPQGLISGAEFECVETGEHYVARAKVVINATGAYCDQVRKLSDRNAKNMISPSQGIHLVLDSSFLESDSAIMIPRTADGRVLFAIPWNGKTLVGTTDTEIDNPTLEPAPLKEEIDFVLATCKQYLLREPTEKDVLSVFVGIRPLVSVEGSDKSSSLSREHTIIVDESNLLTISGGKWTTYRSMASETIDHAVRLGKLSPNGFSTENLEINSNAVSEIASLIAKEPELNKALHPKLEYTKADVVNGIRKEMAKTLEDILARRTRVLFLDAKLAVEIAPMVAKIMARELNEDEAWIKSNIADFEKVARNYSI